MFYTSIASWSLALWNTLNAAGIDADAVFTAAGADVSLLKQTDARFDLAVMSAVWEQAALMHNKSCLGIAVAGHWHPTTFHALGFAWLASPDLNAGIKRLVRHIHLVNTSAAADFQKQSNGYRFSLNSRDTTIGFHPQAGLAGLATLVRMIRDLLGSDFKPLEVNVPAAGGQCAVAGIEAYFQCPVSSEGADFAVLISSAEIEQPLVTGNNDLLLSADKSIADYLRRLDHDDILSKARLEIMKQLSSGEVSEESIADSLHLSLRTFQRRLKEKGEGYRGMLDSVRREMAQQLVSDPKYSITEISYLLGFAEPSSFSRTYKRWTGSTPSQQRAG